jgi:hypothetical protein
MVKIEIESEEARILIAVLLHAHSAIRDDYSKRYDSKIDKELALIQMDSIERIRQLLTSSLGVE